jgi:hypothetical protein
MGMGIPSREQHEFEDRDTRRMLELVYREDRDQTIYHWFLEAEITQDEAEEKAKSVFGLRNDLEIVQEDMFDSITIMFDGEDNVELEDRHDELFEA